MVYSEYKRGPRTDLTKFQNTSIYWYLETECNHPNTIETIPVPYHQGVKVRYSDPQYQMPRKDQGAAKSLIFSDLRQLRYHYRHGLVSNPNPNPDHGHTHTASLKSRCFLFIFIILVFILDFRLVRKLVFLYFNVNVYLKEIPCLNKVTLPYLTLPYHANDFVNAKRNAREKPLLAG